MIYTTKTNTNIKIVKEELETKAKESGFGVLHTYDFKQILHSKGFPIEKEITVYELCNPPGAQQALSAITAISVYLPCRISIYEEDGHTTLSTIGFEDILSSVNVNEDFKTHMIIIYKNLKHIMHSWDR
ncbi:putative protein [hydrothermal vent metagenome]|uniref:DUF302 domain-containing protein n=1 Tax=hydrothermal vent metagenome TaxID=652676 RepID=A0A1W1EC33_9ZZZZ